ncbi:aminoglycoside/choline kinase family phosphotransferase [Marmoricola sp. OAE513]|uniref:phosphotransferase family protein n=1 Tax=Marmoricola sp. OAE513 TaxID=2817894 RepID=UPI001AE4C2D3
MTRSSLGSPPVDLPVLGSLDELSTTWLSTALGAEVEGFTLSPVGTGQMGSCYRITLTGDTALPGTALLKLPSADEGTRAMVAGAYRTEVRFYTEVLPTVGIHTPRRYATSTVGDDGLFAMLLEDMAPAQQGDQIAGCTPDQARDAAVNLAGLHGPRWSDPTLHDVEGLTLSGPDDAALLAEVYGPATDTFLEQLGDALTPETQETLRRCVGAAEQWSLARQSERFGLVHGDYRLDNLLFLADPGADALPVSAVDWQTLSLGLPARDLAYLLGTGLSVEDRREHERAIVEEYHADLLVYGVTDYTAEQAFDDYRFAMLQGPLVSVFGCAYGARTERGDAMFAAMVNRSCTAMRDLGTLDLVGAS